MPFFENDFSLSGLKKKMKKFRNMVTVEARVVSFVSGNLKVFLRGEFNPEKTTKNIADGLFRTVQCNDKSMLQKNIASLQNLDRLFSNACNTLFNVPLL